MYHKFSVPNSPQDIRVNDINAATTSSIDIIWDSPSSGEYNAFYLEWFKGQTMIGSKALSATQMTISGLQGGQSYSVSVYAVSNDVKSSPNSGSFTTSMYQNVKHMCFLSYSIHYN